MSLISTSYHKFEKELIEPENVSYPLDIEFIPEFEKLNNLKINIYELIEEELSEDDENYDENNTTSKLFPKILCNQS